MKANLTLKFSIKHNRFKRSKKESAMFVNLSCYTSSKIMFEDITFNVFSITTLNYTSMKVKLLNKSMIYENDEIKNVYVEFIREFFSL